MAITTELKETWKEDKVILQNAITLLKKNLSDYKTQRRSEWKTFKNKFNDDLFNVEK